MSDVDKAFDMIEGTMLGRALDSAGRQGIALGNSYQNFIQDYLKEVFPDLAAYIDDGIDAPFPALGVSWVPLSQKYQDWKIAKGLDNGFANLRGGVVKAINNLGYFTDELFGEIRASVSASMGHPWMKYTMNRAGRWQVAKGVRNPSGGRGLGGQFASNASIADFKDIRVSLAFMRPDGSRIDSEISRSWVESNINQRFAAFEFGRTRGRRQEARPLLVPYLKWKLGPQLEAEINKRFPR